MISIFSPRTSTRYVYSIVVHHDANAPSISCVLFGFTGAFGKLVARCLVVLRATDVFLACCSPRGVLSLSVVTLANAETSASRRH